MKSKILILMLCSVLVLSSCAANEGSIDTSEGQQSDETNDELDENITYLIEGEVKSVNDQTVLMKSETCGLIYVTLPDVIEGVKTRDYIEVAYSGEIMESYPCQATGYKITNIIPYEGETYYNLDELNELISAMEGIEDIEWSDFGDYVVYTQKDLANALADNYFVYVAGLFMEEPMLVHYIEGVKPEVSWFLGALQVGTASSYVEYTEPFQPYDMDVVDLQDLLEYEMVMNERIDEANDFYGQYYEMTGYKGELVQDYINQSLQAVMWTYNGMFVGVHLEAEILRQDEFLTVATTGEVTDLGRPVEDFLTIHVPTATVISIENVIGDMNAFKDLFQEKAGISYDELEGVGIYFTNESIICHFVPLDDMAERVYVTFNFEELETILSYDFEMPMS